VAAGDVDQGSRALLGIAMSDARELVRDLAPHRPWVYWTDLLASLAIGWTAFLLWPIDHPWSVASVLCVVISALAWYRAVIFVHEIVHMPAGRLRGFYWGWHILCGVPMLVPAFIYEFHLDHHSARTYGTVDDGEYVAFASGPRWRVAVAPLSALGGFPAFVVRFLVLAPLSWLVPALRPFVLSRASALAIDAEFQRAVPVGPLPRNWIVQEALCFCSCVAMLVLVVTGVIVPMRLVEIYTVFTVLLFVNWLRVLGAHRYEGRRVRMSFPEQVLDSVDHVSFAPIAELWAPLGLRYHAVHHLFPALPYHALPEARRRLARALPADSGYWRSAQPRLTSTIIQLLHRERPVAARVLAERQESAR
jgi:fatty acid desaturase